MKSIALAGALFTVLTLTACGPAATTSTTASTESTTAAEEPLPPGAPCPSGTYATEHATTYSCDNGVTFSVAFETQTSCAVVNAGGQTYRLGSAISGSGARYSDAHTMYWDHQGEATLEGAAGGPYENCKAPAE